MFRQQFVHLEHVGTVGFKYQPQLFVAHYFPFVTRVLEIVLPNICPELLHDLKSKNGTNILVSICTTKNQKKLARKHELNNVNCNLSPRQSWVANNGL